MITVHYKPFEALRPVHVAVMAAAEANLSSQELLDTFGLPQLILEHAGVDLISWGLASFKDKRITLTLSGSRCVSVWVDTEQRGFWSFPNPEGWRLGKGVFFFKSPLSQLSDAGLNPDTGIFISHKECMAMQNVLTSDTESLEKEIQNESASRAIASCFKLNDDPSEMIAVLLGRPRNRLHLNQLCRLMKATLDDCESDDAAAQKWIRFAWRCINDQREQAERRLRNEQRSMQPVQEVLLAKWLSERTGLLREIVETEPCSILIRSDFEAVAPVPSLPAKAVELAPSIKRSESVMDGLKDIFRSFFK